MDRLICYVVFGYRQSEQLSLPQLALADATIGRA